MPKASTFASMWPFAAPLAAAALLVAALALPPSLVVAVLSVPALVAAVIASVHHAEVIAHRIGEPYGTLVLAVAVTVIEVALIVSVMLAGGVGKATLPRDTIFSAIMIICNGVVGLCLVVGGLRHHEQSFRLDGANSSFAALIALTTLSLVLPAFTISSAGSTYTTSQLAFAALASLALWAVFVFFQTVSHRDYFLPPAHVADEQVHAQAPPDRQAWTSFGLLMVALVAVVGLAKVLSPGIERAVASAGAPPGVIGVVIALLVLLPETWAALRAAHANRLQTSLNLALGSALASIGLTIPAVALASVLLDLPLVLGLEAKDLVLLALTFLIGSITLVSGRTNMLQGTVHLVVFAAFLFLALVP
jgi:Ca2+:H+ antiporter